MPHDSKSFYAVGKTDMSVGHQSLASRHMLFEGHRAVWGDQSLAALGFRQAWCELPDLLTLYSVQNLLHLTCLSRSLSVTCSCQRGRRQPWLSEMGTDFGEKDGEWVVKGPRMHFSRMLVCCSAMTQLCLAPIRAFPISS